MTIEVQDTGHWYPNQPPAFPGESDDAYTNRLTGYTGMSPYDHRRNRQCSIGYHEECSDPGGEWCECPCHPERVNAEVRVRSWNARIGLDNVVSLIESAGEPPVATTSAAYVHNGWPVVELATFPNPVRLSWLVGGEDEGWA
jgi:hypothetical protein